MVVEESFFLGGTSNLSVSRAGFNSVSQTSSASSDAIDERTMPAPGGVIAGELAAALLFPAILGGEVSVIVMSSGMEFGASDTMVTPNITLSTLAEVTDDKRLDRGGHSDDEAVLLERLIYVWVVVVRNSWSNHVLKFVSVRNREITMDFSVVKVSWELEDEESKLVLTAEV